MWRHWVRMALLAPLDSHDFWREEEERWEFGEGRYFQKKPGTDPIPGIFEFVLFLCFLTAINPHAV